MKVLNLTTKERSPCFQNQVRALERRGVDCTNVSVPGDVAGDASRSVIDYLRFHPTVLKHSLGSYDLVHANYGLTAPFALAQPRLPVVLSLWGSDLHGQFGWLSKLCASQCDATIVMSEGMARELGRECHVVPHGVELDLFDPRPQRDAQDELGWESDVHNVLFPYRPGREVKDYPRAKRIVEAVDGRLSTRVEIRTAVGESHSRMPTFMNAADCLLMTSRREGSPNVVKEALACNLPVVSTDVGDVQERLDGVDLSTVGTSDEALIDALTEILRVGDRSNGREQIAALSSERMAERLSGVYRSVLDGTGA